MSRATCLAWRGARPRLCILACCLHWYACTVWCRSLAGLLPAPCQAALLPAADAAGWSCLPCSAPAWCTSTCCLRLRARGSAAGCPSLPAVAPRQTACWQLQHRLPHRSWRRSACWCCLQQLRQRCRLSTAGWWRRPPRLLLTQLQLQAASQRQRSHCAGRGLQRQAQWLLPPPRLQPLLSSAPTGAASRRSSPAGRCCSAPPLRSGGSRQPGRTRPWRGSRALS